MLRDAVKRNRQLAAIVSTYEPGENILDNLRLIAAEVNHVYLVNDSGRTDIAKKLAAVVSDICNLDLIDNERNIGLAATLNSAIGVGEAAGFKHVIVFDDDTKINPGSISRLRALSSSCSNDMNVYCLSRTSSKKVPSTVLTLVERKVSITSGSMFSIELFNSVGGFDPSFYIDLLDFDYCLRVLAAGGKILQTNTAEIQHFVGNPIYKKVLCFSIMTHNHRPARYYYYFRSAVLLTKKHYLSQPLHLLWIWGGLCYKVVTMVMLEKSKLEKLRFLGLGILHGIIGNYSSNPRV